MPFKQLPLKLETDMLKKGKLCRLDFEQLKARLCN
jgi:hypothetical protein